jgi:hypothetical protein
LLREVHEAWDKLQKSKVNVNDHTQGILQAIGLKEFAPLLQKLDSKKGNDHLDILQTPNLESGNILDEKCGAILEMVGKSELSIASKKDNEGLNRLQITNLENLDEKSEEVEECVQNVKLHTRQYARVQMKWIRKLVDGDGTLTHSLSHSHSLILSRILSHTLTSLPPLSFWSL